MEIELTFFPESLCGTKWFAEQSDWIHFSSWNREAADWMKGGTQSQDNQSKFHLVTCAKAWLKIISWVSLILFRRFPPPPPFFSTLNRNRTKTNNRQFSNGIWSRKIHDDRRVQYTNWFWEADTRNRQETREWGASSPGKEKKRNKLQTSQTPWWDVGFPSVPFVSPSPFGATTIYWSQHSVLSSLLLLF